MIAPETAPKPTRNEGLKTRDPLLVGTIRQTLDDSAKDRFSEDDYEFLKFHGIYQQDDRDKRKIAKQYIFMVRGRLPGGSLNPDVYLAFDRLCQQFGNNTLRITTRQGFQFHGITKGGLGGFMKGLNEAMATTLAACGDVNRNVMAAPTPAASPLVDEIQHHAKTVSDALLPRTRAYHQIWVEGVELKLTAQDESFVDPLYGKSYLPRKFKVAFAIPPLNDIDVFTNDCGFVAIIEEGRLAGYNLLAGGGLGMSHGNAQTYPRLADVIGFVTPGQVVETAKGVVTIHRDFGDRTNRKHARLKYVIEERGVPWFRQELERRLGFDLAPARPFEFTIQGDLYGWRQQFDGNYFLGLFVENGRIKDAGDYRLKTGLRSVVERFKPDLRLTPSQNILLVNIKAEDRNGITEVLAAHGVPVEDQGTVIRRASIACPALPTCGLALAESERVMPDILTRLEQLLAEVGLDGEEIIIRMTGCPNGCARPYTAELALVGKAPGKYQLYLGGNQSGTRLGALYRESVKNEDLVNELRPLFSRFARERIGAERFGDFSQRVLLPEKLAV
ncbi:MAG TPA: NADPH-dependent assimilatory sulfite reductase hemoprotein subunit [Candidatus Baltobacteraceae bacterium]|jgi:sulfite reductase (NADPH) hemoprotein beta-component|nr:NADPH-dependent assimilatory sulfite reductase hemoprotein subunit [Candidatus Baltobacteraceae bacterium]